MYLKKLLLLGLNLVKDNYLFGFIREVGRRGGSLLFRAWIGLYEKEEVGLNGFVYQPMLLLATWQIIRLVLM